MNRDEPPRHPAEDQSTGVANPQVGTCEECGKPVCLTDAVTESYPGHEGRVTLLFCRECAR